MVGSGIAAKNGILIKGGGSSLQMSCNIGAIAFDKTGTFTLGKPSVVKELVSVSNLWKNKIDSGGKPLLSNFLYNEQSFWRVVKEAESGSSHPIAKAIVEFAEIRLKAFKNVMDDCKCTLTHLTEVSGKGLEATFEMSDDKNNQGVVIIFIGNRRWILENGCLEVPDSQGK